MRNHDNHNHVIAHLLKASAAISISVFLAACGDDTSKTSGGSVEDQEVVAISDKTVSGVSQKGPFVNGSSVTVQELDGETLAQTGNSYEGKIKNDMGEFSVKVTKLASQYALLKANGFYRNEVSGEKSKSQVTLYALTDLSNRDEVNVNLLTHLEYERSLYLVSVDSMSVADAKKQAEKEVLASFGIDGIFANSEDLSIFGKGDENAALLAISILMQGDLSEADFSERLADYAADIETDGKWDDAKTVTEIADWGAAKSLGQSLSYIRTKITDWGLSAEVPAFEKYVDNYWWQNYGLGTCEETREGEVLQNQNSVSQNYGVFFICDNKAWRLATDIEKDSYSWQDSVNKDADVKWGSVNTNICYVFEDKVWRNGDVNDCSLGLRGCTTLKQDTVGLGSDKVWYICDAKKWREAINSEKDTYGWRDTTDGIIMKGSVSDNLYIFDVSKWRLASEADIELERCSEAVLGIKYTLGKTTFICEKNDQFYGWNEFNPNGKWCYPESDSVSKGKSVKWRYSLASPCSALEVAKECCKFKWSFEGGVANESESLTRPVSGEVLYSELGTYKAFLEMSVNGGKTETIVCSPLKVVDEMNSNSVGHLDFEYYTLVHSDYPKSVPGFEVMKQGFNSCGIDLTDFENPVVIKEKICFDKIKGKISLVKVNAGDSTEVSRFGVNVVDVATSSHYRVSFLDSTGAIHLKPPMDFDIQTEAFAGEFVPVYIIGGTNLDEVENWIDYEFFEFAKESVYTLDYNYRVMNVYSKNFKGEMQLLSQNEVRTIDKSGVDTVYVTVSENNIEGKQSAFSIGVNNKISITFKVQGND